MKLKNSYLEKENKQGEDHRSAKHNKHIVIDDGRQERENNGEEQTGEPVDQSGQRHGRAARILWKHLSRVKERNGSETDGEANNEDENASGAHVRVNGIVVFASQKEDERGKVQYDDGDGEDKKRTTADSIDERHADNCGYDIYDAGAEDGVLNALERDSTSQENVRRIVKDLD